jgi:hypothetical protein
LPEQLVDGVAGQVDERLASERDWVTGQSGVCNQHRHAGHANCFDENTASISNGFHVAFGQCAPGRVRHILLKLVHREFLAIEATLCC